MSIRTAENLVVIKTENGSANAAAELIDRLGIPEIVGVIAGDNTIFIAVESYDLADKVAEQLENLLQ